MPTDSSMTSLPSLTGANLASGDELEVVDISDTSLAPTGTNKSMTAVELAKGLGLATVGGGVASPGVVSGAADIAIANTETVVKSVTVAANEMTVNTAWDIQAWFTKSGTTSAAPVIRVRLGPTTLGGAVIGSLTCPADTLASPGLITAHVQVRDMTTPSATSMIAQIKREIHLAAVTLTPAFSGTSGGTTFDATAAALLELTFISGNAANTFTFRSVSINKISA